MHLADIHFDPQNARRHNSRNIGMIAESLQEFGPARSITIDELNVVLAGNGVVEAAAQIGVEHVRVFDRATGVLEPEPPGQHIFAVRVSGLSPEQKKLYAIADNRTTDLSDFDPEVIAAFQDEGLDVEQFWFPEELAELLAGADEPAEGLGNPDDVPEPPADPITKPGDVWLLGDKHRLLCGDSTVVTDVDRLMGGRKADMVLTDPPYGMDLDTDFSTIRGALGSTNRTKGTRGNTYDRVIGDDGDFDPSFLMSYFGYVREQFWFGADYYAGMIPDRASGSWLVWDKRKESQSDAIGSEFELCWSKQKHKRRMLRHDWFGFLSSENGSDARNRVHPTQKPVTLLLDIMEQWGKASDLVVDPFGGSGTTLLACEQAGRTAYLCEIDPKYCDVIIARYETHTGQTATREQVEG